MLNSINNLKPSRSPLRLFLFILFGLVVFILLVEGGYYFWLQNKEVTFPKSEEQMQPQATNEVVTDWINLIEGEINEIRGRTLIITVTDNPSVFIDKVEIEVADDADIFTGDELGDIKPILFTDLKVGDTIQAGILTKTAEAKFKVAKFKAESIYLDSYR